MAVKKSRRTAWAGPADAPAVLPHVIITVAETGDVDVTVDGNPFPPPAAGVAWTRGTFGELLDAVTAERTIAVRIEVRETAGSVFTDIIRARKPKPSPPAEDTPPQDTRQELPGTEPETGTGPELVEVTGEGFVPGEDIALAVIISHTDATPTGHTRALIDTGQLSQALDGGTGEVVLLGRVSGTLQLRRLS